MKIKYIYVLTAISTVFNRSPQLALLLCRIEALLKDASRQQTCKTYNKNVNIKSQKQLARSFSALRIGSSGCKYLPYT